VIRFFPPYAKQYGQRLGPAALSAGRKDLFMARKTPPVANQVIGPYVRSNAYIKGRLIDFDTGKADLENQHMAWLREKVSYAKMQSDYTIWIIGYASKLGDGTFNEHLSNDRMNAVLKFIRTVDDRALSKIELWKARGSAGYEAAANDNSADERAVEVHIFIGTTPPPPPHVDPHPRPLPPLPGGKRYSKWSVAAPGGGVANIAPGLVVGFNIFVFRNEETNEQKAYISPQVGLGLSLSLKGGKLLLAAQTLLTSGAYSNMDFTPFTTSLPVTWDEIGDSLATVTGGGAGAGKGVQAAHFTIDAPSVWRYSSAGTPIRKDLHLVSFDSFGKDYQIGAGASAVAGPLILVAE
jgi:hypothetical protein